MTTSIFTYDATGRVTREVLTSLNSHNKQIDKVEAEANKLQVTAIKNYRVLVKAGLEPSDLVSPDKQSNGTCTPEEYAVLVCAGAERQWGAKSAKYKQVWRYLHDRDNMTTSQKKTAKTHFKSVKRSLKIISKNYADWLADGSKDAGAVNTNPRTVKPADEFILERLKSTQAKADKANDELKAKYDEFDLAVFTQLLAPAKAYMDQLGKAKPSSKQVSFDSNGNRRAKK